MGLRQGWVLNSVGKVFWVLRKWEENNGLFWCFFFFWWENEGKGVFLIWGFCFVCRLFDCEDLMLFDFFDSLLFGTKAWLSLFLLTNLGK